MNRVERFGVLACVAIAVLAVTPAQDPSTPAASGTATQTAQGPSTIMFIDFSQVLQGTEEAKREFSKIETFVNEQNKQLETRTKELDDLKNQYVQQQRALNQATLAEMQRDIQKKEKALQRYKEDTAAEIQQRQNDVVSVVGQKIQVVLEEVAKEKDYSAILFMDSMQGGYFSPANDISEDIVARYNQKHPVATGTGQ